MKNTANLSASRIAGTHCENCGSTDREDLETGDQGYTACCNELACYGDASGFVAVVEEGNLGRREIVATVSGACCSASVDQALAAAGIHWTSSHQDCTSPACAPHATRSYR